MLHDVLAESLKPRPNEYRRFVHSRIIGAARGFVGGGFAGAARGFFRGGRPTRPTSQISQPSPAFTQSTSTRIRLGPFGPSMTRTRTMNPVIQAAAVAAAPRIVEAVASRLAGPVAPTADGCPKGFHLNKSAYSLKDGTRIEERTLCVKNRRRNNDNGRAALRAARRLVGRKKHQETIDKALRAIAPSRPRRSSKRAPQTGATIVSTAG